jgi:hypothetical protein
MSGVRVAGCTGRFDLDTDYIATGVLHDQINLSAAAFLPQMKQRRIFHADRNLRPQLGNHERVQKLA